MRIAILGGDKRMLFAARAFADEGHDVFVAGFDHLLSLCEIRIGSIEEAVADCDFAVLPVRPVKEGALNAPFFEKKTPIIQLMAQIGEKPVFTGCAQQIQPYAAGAVFDYAAREDFTLRNAELTAEGAIGLLINAYEGAICGADILVTGYGRIGRVLSAYLKAMGADVTVAARNPADRLKITGNGMTAADYPEIDFGSYPVIFNTVPAPVMGRDAVDQMREDVFLIDLASMPGGIDCKRARERELSCLHALSLPGKTAPLTAGHIIKDTIMNILSEKNNW